MGVEERWFPSLVVVCTGPLHISPSFVPSDDLASLAEGFSYGFCISTILVSNFSLSSVALGLLIQIGIDTGSWTYPREGAVERFREQTDYASVLVSLIKMVWFGTDRTHHSHHHLRAAFVEGSIRLDLTVDSLPISSKRMQIYPLNDLCFQIYITCEPVKRS